MGPLKKGLYQIVKSGRFPEATLKLSPEKNPRKSHFTQREKHKKRYRQERNEACHLFKEI